MTAKLHRLIAVHSEEASDSDLARLDDDGGARQRSQIVPAPLVTVKTPVRLRDERFKTPMIPGAREPGMLTTFGVPAIIIPDSPSTMDATTITAHQREGGGAPNQRRPSREGSLWKNLRQTLRRALFAADQS